jgi:tRNA threonylcarbamoyl adenosine modification protein YjeE
LHRFLLDEEATARLGNDLATALRPGDIVALSGDLGAGKTALARAIIRTLAGEPDLDVPSPTFTLVQRYDTSPPVHHFDLYRTTGPEEMEELGLAEAAGEGVVLVEWPERGGNAVRPTIEVELTERDGGRQARISADGAALARLEHSFRIREFLAAAGWGEAHRAYLLGDASIRAYETVEQGGETLILMDAPERRDEKIVKDGQPYSRIARLAQSVRAFAAVADALRRQGFSAPEIKAQDYEQGLLLIEHLGTGQFLDAAGAPIPARYVAAAGLLAALHARAWPRDLPIPGNGVHHLPPYDHAALAIETGLLLDWYLPFMTGTEAPEADRARYHAIWQKLFERLDRAERSMVLRDFHSPNIIWRAERQGLDRLGLIDVQDAVYGPAAYDVASLAFDARVDVPEALEREIVEAYCAARAGSPAFDRAGFEAAYAITAAQRNSKLLGTFVRLDRRDGKPAYLKHLPRIRAYLRRALRHPVLAELAAFYDEAGLLREPAA